MLPPGQPFSLFRLLWTWRRTTQPSLDKKPFLSLQSVNLVVPRFCISATEGNMPESLKFALEILHKDFTATKSSLARQKSTPTSWLEIPVVVTGELIGTIASAEVFVVVLYFYTSARESSRWGHVNACKSRFYSQECQPCEERGTFPTTRDSYTLWGLLRSCSVRQSSKNFSDCHIRPAPRTDYKTEKARWCHEYYLETCNHLVVTQFTLFPAILGLVPLHPEFAAQPPGQPPPAEPW